MQIVGVQHPIGPLHSEAPLGQAQPRNSSGDLTLEPLRTFGRDALDTAGAARILKVTLCELEVTAENTFHEVTVHRADDLFGCVAAEGPCHCLIPAAGTITRAVFLFHLADCPCPVTVQICIPDTIIITPACDAHMIELWFAQSHFTTRDPESPP